MNQVEEIAQSTLNSDENVSSSSTPNIPTETSQVVTQTVPIAPAQPLLKSTTTLKRVKRGFRSCFNNKKFNRTLTKPATILARPSTILPQTQKPILLSHTIAPVVPPPVQTNSNSGFTTYLVVDGGQGQFVQVANDGQKPVTFQNQSGQILQATPISVVSATNQPVVSSFPINGDCSLLSNSSQTITTVRTSSSIDMQQQTTLTSETTTQQLTGIIHPPSILPTNIINGNNLQTFNNTSINESNNNLSLSIAQIAQKVNHRHRRSSSSSLSRKKRGRPRLYERDPFTNKPIKSDIPTGNVELTIPTVPNTTFLMSAPPTATFNTLPNHCTSLIFPNQKPTISISNPSLLQQHQYSYPSLLNGTNKIEPPIINNPTPLTPIILPYSSPSKEYSQSSVTPIKSTNNDVTVHYMGGFIIRESNHSFVSNNNKISNQNENIEKLRCCICEKLDLSERFYNQEKKLCSQLCSLKINENKPLEILNEPIRNFENAISQQLTKSNSDEKLSSPSDNGFPNDPTKWTVFQVGEFIARLTNETIRQAFHESEIDGQALLLISPEHLRDTMKIKLGPSLIISSEITKLRERVKTLSS